MASYTVVSFQIFLLTMCLGVANSVDFNYPAVFNFGDSNSDTGEFAAGIGFQPPPPNGQSYFKTPSGRFCDGRLIVDFLSIFLTFTSILQSVFISNFPLLTLVIMQWMHLTLGSI